MARVTPRLRVAFLGNADRSVPSLEALVEGEHDVVLVVTRDARPAGRGHRPRRTAVAEAADRFGVPLIEVPTVATGEGLDRLRSAEPDAVAVVAYGEILPAAVLGVPTRLPVNVHFSLLPRWRGAAPVERAILAGDRVTGVTTMRMTEGLDEGPILGRVEETIGEADAGTLGARLAAKGGALLVDTLDRLAVGALEEVPQEDAMATVAPKIRREERIIDWSRPAAEIVRLVRAFGPEPGATASFRGRGLKILRAELGDAQAKEARGASPGTLLEVAVGDRPELVAASGDGEVVALVEVVPAGGKRMSGAAFARGARVRPDERLD